MKVEGSAALLWRKLLYGELGMVMMRAGLWFVNPPHLDFLLLGATTHNDSHSGFRCFPFLSFVLD